LGINAKAQNNKKMARRMQPTLKVFIDSCFILSPHAEACGFSYETLA